MLTRASGGVIAVFDGEGFVVVEPEGGDASPAVTLAAAEFVAMTGLAGRATGNAGPVDVCGR